MAAKRVLPKAKSHNVFGQARKPAKMFRAGLYARVSTNDQQTIPLQIRALLEYAVRRGWTITLQVKEVGSGASQRQLREKLLAAARRREIDVVLVWRLDRWGRSVADLLATLQELDHLGVGFVSLTEALDLTTPAGRAMAAMLAVFAEFEREILRERVRAGLAHARQNGKRLGRPQQPDCMPIRCGNYTEAASVNPRLPAVWRSGGPRFAGFWRPTPQRNSSLSDDWAVARTTLGGTGSTSLAYDLREIGAPTATIWHGAGKRSVLFLEWLLIRAAPQRSFSGGGILAHIGGFY